MNYTKGDWKVDAQDLTIRSNDFKNGTQMGDYRGVIIADLKPALGCDTDLNGNAVLPCSRDHAYPQTLANANLIAAAPDLVEALKESQELVERAVRAGFILSQPLQSYKALAKAEGK